MMLLRVLKPLRRGLGATLHSVDRASLGDVYFLTSIPVLFSVAPVTLLYVVPLLVLTFADALAALIGVRYGRRRYEGVNGVKSVEGSTAFFVVAFFSAHVPLLLFSDVGRAESLLIALLVGFQVMLLEAVAWDGIDNLFIPLGTYIILRGNMDETPAHLMGQFAVAATIVTLFFVLRRRTGLRGSALVGAAFVCFMCWSMAGNAWLVAPLTLFVATSYLWSRGEIAEVSVPDLLGLVAPALAWMLLAVYRQHPEFLYPYTLALAALWTALWSGSRRALKTGTLLTGSVASAALFLGPYLLLDPALVGSGAATWLLRAAHGVLVLVLVAYAGTVLAARRADAPPLDRSPGQWPDQPPSPWPSHLSGAASIAAYAATLGGFP
jgi:phytol kinase